MLSSFFCWCEMVREQMQGLKEELQISRDNVQKKELELQAMETENLKDRLA